MCPYGASCYRRNPTHFDEEDHPDDHPLLQPQQDTSSSSAASGKRKAVGDDAAVETSAAAAAPGPPLGWRNNTLHPGWVEAGLVPASANRGTCSLADLLGASALSGATSLHIINMMIDLDWMISECPAIRTVPHVTVLHGDDPPPNSTAVKREPSRFTCLRPPCERYGTHHSKAIIILKPNTITIHVLTGNFIFADWHNKTNGVWSGTFPARSHTALPPNLDAPPTEEGFEKDLFAYYHGVKALGINPPVQWSPQGQSGAWAQLDLSWIRRYDYSGSNARLVASLPGRHVNADLHKWGHMGVRRLIDAEALAAPGPASGITAPLVLQFSSLSSPGTNTNWLAELVRSFCGPSASPSRVEVLYPTQEQVRQSLEGWVAGSSIPCDLANAEKCRARLKELGNVTGLPTGTMCSWDGGEDGAYGGAGGRSLAVPHIKTYCRYDGNRLLWALLGSHNLSQAAWGKCEKNGTQLYIKSYELGVLLLPSLLPTGSELRCASKQGGEPPANSLIVPLPYSLPPRPYGQQDRIWCSSDGQQLPLSQHAAPPDRHGRHAGEPGSGGNYGPRCWGAVSVERARATAKRARQS